MIRHQLALIGYKSGIYIAIFVFFLACFLGYASNLAIDTIIKKAVIAGCALGFLSCVLVRILVTNLPQNIGIENYDDSNDVNKSGK